MTGSFKELFLNDMFAFRYYIQSTHYLEKQPESLESNASLFVHVWE